MRADIESFPLGDRTVVSGTSLSGGQRQRLSLARAAYSSAKVRTLSRFGMRTHSPHTHPHTHAPTHRGLCSWTISIRSSVRTFCFACVRIHIRLPAHTRTLKHTHPSQTVLLDDPLSALDFKVSAHVFRECICGVMKGRTVVLATHHGS